MNSRTVQLILAAVDRTRKPLRDAQGRFMKTSKVGQKAAAVMSSAFRKVTATVKKLASAFKTALTGGLIVAIAAMGIAFVSSVRQAAAFEQSMANVQSVLGGTEEEMQRVSDAARDMARTSVFTAQQAAGALYDLASSGFDAEQSIAALGGTMALAAATASDLQFATETMTSVIKQFDLLAEDSERVANAFAATISFSKMNMERLSTSMSFAGPIASGFGHELEGTLATLSQFANMGLRASMIGTTFRMGLLQLGKSMPARQIEKGEDVLKRLGIQFKNIDPATHSVADIVERLHGKVTKMSEAVALFGVRAGGPWLKLIKAGAGPLREMEKKITDTRKAHEMAETQIKTFKGSLKQFWSAVQEAQISLGTAFLPALTRVVEQFTEWVNIINQINWADVWKGFTTNAETGIQKLDEILDMFKSGGAFREALKEWGYFFLDVVTKMATVIWRPIETEFNITVMKMMEKLHKQLGQTFLGRKLGFDVEVARGYDERRREAHRRVQGERQARDVEKLFKVVQPRAAVRRTTEAFTQFESIVSGPDKAEVAMNKNETVMREEGKRREAFTKTVVDSIGRQNVVIADSLEKLNAEIARLKEMDSQLAAGVKRAMSSGRNEVGALH